MNKTALIWRNASTESILEAKIVHKEYYQYKYIEQNGRLLLPGFQCWSNTDRFMI